MKLTQKPVFRVEDFPTLKEAQKLFSTLNPLITNLNQIFDNNIDFATNIRSVTKNFYQIGITLPTSFTWSHAGFTPQSLQIVKAKVDTIPCAMQAAWDFNASTSLITISAVYILGSSTNTAISATSVYEFTVRVTI